MSCTNLRTHRLALVETMSVTETVVLFALRLVPGHVPNCQHSHAFRGVLLLSCRRYLLRSLYSDLQSLSDSTTSDEEVEGTPLETLPQPNTTTSRDAANTNSPKPLHDTVSRLIFSMSFSECCMMFLLLMLQGLEVFDAKWVKFLDNI